MGKYMQFRIYAGGESCLDSENDLSKILDRWNDLFIENDHILPLMLNWKIKARVSETPTKGQILIGLFDGSFVPPESTIRRTPRGYMLMWEEIEVLSETVV